MYLLYSLLFTLVAILGSPYWLYRALREKKYLINFSQRLGWTLPNLGVAERPLWIHAVSVGEVLAAKPLIKAIRKIRPEIPIALSTVTLAGQALAKAERLDTISIFYFPFDWDFSVRRFLSRLEPRGVVVMETELWPNFLRRCRLCRIPVFIANGRISDSSFVRYGWIKTLAKSFMKNLRVIGVQTLEDKRRFAELGVREDRIRVTGNLKFDYPVPTVDANNELFKKVQIVLSLTPETPVVVVGSSMKGEEPLFLEAFRLVRNKVKGVRMILAPRNPERFTEVAALLEASCITYQRRTQLDREVASNRVEILLLDTIGELRALYSLASVAVIGGSFLFYGGHNPLEPAALGKPIVFGPDMSNFQEMAKIFLDEQAARQSSAAQLPDALFDLLRDSKARNLLGRRAASTYSKNQGATQITMDFLLPHIS